MTSKDEITGMSAGDFRNVAYRAILEECEHIEHIGKYKGNGHHLAQRLADMVSNELTKEHHTVEKQVVTKHTTKSK